MLNPSYRYIGLDFETTGLDFDKDEPIQIGIVEIDHTGKVIQEFSSLLKPQRDLNELKTIVGFITGLDIAGLASSPTPAELEPEIQSFFGENTVLIGHNIAFDEKFLQKFFPNCSYWGSLDTYPLAQVLLHYQSSYALEILIKNTKIADQSTDAENFHDALFDTQNAIKLFLFMVEKIQKLAHKYPVLNYYIKQDDFCLSKFLTQTDTEIKVPNNITIPKLNKIQPANTQAQSNEKTINTDELEHGKRYFVGNCNLKTFLERSIGNKNIILAFSNLQKLEIAKNLLNDMGIKNLGFLKDEQIIDYDKFTNFFQKEYFSDGEVKFILKYYSHVDQGYGMLDLNTKSDYQIYYSIKNKKIQTKYPIVLATHQGLFYSMQEGENVYKDHEIFFLDAERWFKSYNFFLSRPLDVYYVLNFIETLIYKKALESEYLHRETTNDEKDLTNFASSFEIFIGQLFMESQMFFVGKSWDQMQVDPLTTNPNFYKSNLLREQIKENYLVLKDSCEADDFLMLDRHMQHMNTIFNTVMSIQKKASNTDYYFVYNETTKYTSRSEFMDIFTTSVYFFSNSDTKSPALFPNEERTPAIPTINIKLHDRILAYILKEEAKQSFFIVSTRKDESKQIFDALYKNDIHKDYALLIENITGGVGKNIAKAKESPKKIIIGGYAFLLSVYANKIPLDEIIIFNIRGNNEQSILDDIQRYAPK